MAAQMPAFAAAPGIPQTTLEASSWAITLPPAATISLPPRIPSEPMPVSTTARTPPCQTSIAEVNNGSTVGVQSEPAPGEAMDHAADPAQAPKEDTVKPELRGEPWRRDGEFSE